MGPRENLSQLLLAKDGQFTACTRMSGVNMSMWTDTECWSGSEHGPHREQSCGAILLTGEASWSSDCMAKAWFIFAKVFMQGTSVLLGSHTEELSHIEPLTTACRLLTLLWLRSAMRSLLDVMRPKMGSKSSDPEEIALTRQLKTMKTSTEQVAAIVTKIDQYSLPLQLACCSRILADYRGILGCMEDTHRCSVEQAMYRFLQEGMEVL